MARTRSIKPGFFTNDLLAEVEPLGRLLFAGLWTVADREGRLEDRPRRLKAEILPYDDADADVLLEALAVRGFILRYAVGGRRIIQIVSWVKHQQPHYKEIASVLPASPGWQDSGVVTFGVPPDQYARIVARDGHACRRCGATERLTVDHMVPRARGGAGTDDDLQVLCHRCNSSKGARENGLPADQLCADVDPTLNHARPDVESTLPPGTRYPEPGTRNPVPGNAAAAASRGRAREAAAAASVPESVKALHASLTGAPGYEPSPAFLEKVAAKYGHLDLEEEAIKMLGWLRSQPKAKRRCSTAFVLNWLDRTAQTAAHAQPRASPNGRARTGLRGPGGRQELTTAQLIVDSRQHDIACDANEELPPGLRAEVEHLEAIGWRLSAGP